MAKKKAKRYFTVTETNQITIRETVSSPFDKISVRIPVDADPEKVRETLLLCCNGYDKVWQADITTKFLIGKTCLVIQGRKLYRDYGYGSFEAFMKAEVYRPTLKRSTVWKGIRAAKAFPEATAAQLAAVPEKNLPVATGIAHRAKLTGKAAIKLLLEAEQQPDFVERHNGPASRPGFAVIRVVTSKSFKKEFEKWLGNREAEEALKTAIRVPDKHHHQVEHATAHVVNGGVHVAV